MIYDDYLIALHKAVKTEWPEIEFDQNLNPDLEDFSDMEFDTDSGSKAQQVEA